MPKALTEDMQVGNLQVLRHERVVLLRGNVVPVTPREFEIVAMLAEHPGWVFSTQQLAGESAEADYSPESVSVLVSRLRSKLATVGADDVIETVRGFGYRLRSNDVPYDEADDACRALRDAAWQVQEAVIEMVHTGTEEQQRDATAVLDAARRSIFEGLAR